MRSKWISKEAIVDNMKEHRFVLELNMNGYFLTAIIVIMYFGMFWMLAAFA